MGTINGDLIRSADITLSRVGVWHADVSSSSDKAITSPVTIEVDGVTFSGSVVRSGSIGGTATTKVVGGKGKLANILPAKNYANGPTLKAILDDVLREAGETLSPKSDLAHFQKNVDSHKWERAEGPASRALNAICDQATATWRVLADGTVWVGSDTYPEAKIKAEHLDEDWVSGCFELAPDKPDLLPGTTYQGQKISYVIHRVKPEGLRTEAYVIQPGNAFERIFSGIRQAIDYSRMYPCTVVAQNGDGTFALNPDDQRIKGSGLDKVSIRHGLPGFEVEVKPGCKVSVGFDCGDPSRPFAALWGTEGEVTRIIFKKGTRSFARIGDSVAVFFPPLMAGTVIVPPSPTPVPCTFTITTNGIGLIETGDVDFLG